MAAMWRQSGCNAAAIVLQQYDSFEETANAPFQAAFEWFLVLLDQEQLAPSARCLSFTLRSGRQQPYGKSWFWRLAYLEMLNIPPSFIHKTAVNRFNSAAMEA